MIDPSEQTEGGGPVRIGPVSVGSPFFLAPMAGYTESPFRRICREMGAGLLYTELTSADGLFFGGRKTRHLLESDEGERPIAAQLFGVDDERLAYGARDAEGTGRFDLVDLNMGCPVRKVVSRGAGAALIRDPDRVAATVAKVVESVRLPVTVKMRSEWEVGDRAGEVAALRAVEAGAVAVTVHARSWRDGHRGDADWDFLAALRERLPAPLIGNGGIRTAADAVEMLRRTGVAAVMIARGALGYPWIFREAAAIVRGQAPPPPPTREERLRTMFRQLDETIEMFERRGRDDPQRTGAIRFRKHAIAYLRALPRFAEFANRVRYMSDRETSRTEILRHLERIEGA